MLQQVSIERMCHKFPSDLVNRYIIQKERRMSINGWFKNLEWYVWLVKDHYSCEQIHFIVYLACLTPVRYDLCIHITCHTAPCGGLCARKQIWFMSASMYFHDECCFIGGLNYRVIRFEDCQWLSGFINYHIMCHDMLKLTHCSLVTPSGHIDLGHIYSGSMAPSHNLNQCWLIINGLCGTLQFCPILLNISIRKMRLKNTLIKYLPHPKSESMAHPHTNLSSVTVPSDFLEHNAACFGRKVKGLVPRAGLVPGWGCGSTSGWGARSFDPAWYMHQLRSK